MSDDDKLEPPKAVDDIVLKKAREAIHAQPHTDRTQQQPARAARWATPVALAATILLCLSIVLNVSLNTNRPTANRPRMTAASADKAPLPPPPPPADRLERKETGAPAQARSSASEDERREDRTPALTADSMSARAISNAPVSKPEAPQVERGAQAEAPPVAGAVPADALKRQAETAEPQQPVLAKRKAEAAVPHPRDPRVWLREIDALRAHGKTAQADAEMQRFRAAFPSYPVQPAAPPASRAQPAAAPASSEPPK
jgi:hypothetical protein